MPVLKASNSQFIVFVHCQHYSAELLPTATRHGNTKLDIVIVDVSSHQKRMPEFWSKFS